MHKLHVAGHVTIGAMFFMTVPSAAWSQSSGAPALEVAPRATAPAEALAGEIVVTAQRRNERLNDVPIAIVAKSGEQLTRAAVTNVRDLVTVTPGLRFGSSVNALPTIRGVFSRQTDPGNDPNVSLYVDGVYQANVIANNFELVGIERVEVLKGPQGTLFGRNATGGAIRIFTREPRFTVTGMADVSYGNYDTLKAKGYISGPLAGDVLAASLSGSYQHGDSFDRDLLRGGHGRGTDNNSVRFKLLAKPSDTLTARLILGYDKRFDANVEGWNTFNGSSVGRNVAGALIPTKPHLIASNVDPFQRSKVYTAALNVTLDTDIGTITSISSYSHTRYRTLQDADFSSINLQVFDISVRQRDVAQELNFASKKFGIFEVSAGAFYYDSVGRYDPLTILSTRAPLYGFAVQRTRAYAGFGELTAMPVERVTLIAGLRHSSERREANGAYVGMPQRPATLPPLGPGRVKFHSTTPRASIRYTLPSDDNVYFTYSRGFKSGGFNLGGLSPRPFQPEKLDAFEIGLKTSPRRAVSANLSAFYYDYRDQQVQAFVGATNFTQNAASSRIYGIDADITARPVTQFTLTTGISYLHARYKDFPAAVAQVPTGPVGCLCGNRTANIDLSGEKLPDAPGFTIGSSGTYREEFSVGTAELTGSVYHTSSYFADTGDRIVQKPYTTVSARASFKPAGSAFTFYVFGKNLTDEHYFLSIFATATGDGTVWAPPRTYGGGIGVNF